MQLYDNGHAQERTGMIMIASGLAIIAVVLFMQYVSISFLSTDGSRNIVLSTDIAKEFNDAGASTFSIIIVAVAMSLLGVNRLLSSWKKLDYERIADQRGTSISQKTRIMISTSLTKEKRVFWLSAISYIIIFLFLSGMVTYSQQNIPSRFGASVPSYYLTGCCGQPGSFPVLTIYASEHLGLLLVPTNVMLLSFMPVLAGINVAIFVHTTKLAMHHRRCKLVSRDISFCGISAGLMAGCPTCAGTILISLFSAGGLSSLGLTGMTISIYQPLFLAASIGMLLAAPIISALGK